MLGDYLSEFAVIVQRGAIAPAALELGFSQSALSRHLATLESELGCKLLDLTLPAVALLRDPDEQTLKFARAVRAAWR